MICLDLHSGKDTNYILTHKHTVAKKMGVDSKNAVHAHIFEGLMNNE